MTTVFTHTIDDYADPRLERAVGDILGQTPARYITAGSRVLVKPNLLLPAPPSAAITTHPSVVGAACRWICDAGGRHPGHGRRRPRKRR